MRQMFYVQQARNLSRIAIFERQRARPGSKISDHGRLAEVAVYFAMSIEPASFGFSCDRSKRRDFPAIAGRLFKLGLWHKVAWKIKRIGDHRRDHGARDDGCDER